MKNEKQQENNQSQETLTKTLQLLPQFDEFKNQLESWEEPLQNFTKSIIWQKIYKFIQVEYQNKAVYPPPNLIFNAFKITPFNKLKVVIIGQDPYHQKNQAMGLSFSVPKNIVCPPSLKNIYKCLLQDKDIINFKLPNHGDLTSWSQQGILLLNTVLTVEDSKPQSHSKIGWYEFSQEVVRVISKSQQGIIFLLWGAPAQQMESLIDQTKHFVLKSSHPSPLSAHRGFLDCQHFSKVNQLLQQQQKIPINWNL